MQHDRDRGLLFGVLAVQLKGVSFEQMAEIATAWTSDPSVSLAKRMAEAGLLADQECAFLEGLVEEAVRAHGGDTVETLRCFGGKEHVLAILRSPLTSSMLDEMDTVPMGQITSAGCSGQEVSGVEETPGALHPDISSCKGRGWAGCSWCMTNS